MNIIEIGGAITGVAGIWLTIQQSRWCFPVGLANVVVSLFLFVEQKLYSDAVQQVFYIVLLSYGWYNWFRPERKEELKISRITPNALPGYFLVAFLIAILMGSFFKYFTDAHLPYLDASATALSFVAQFMIARKKIENWPLWIVVNILYIGIYFYKELYLYTGLFAIYLLLAINGWKTWHKAMTAASYK